MTKEEYNIICLLIDRTFKAKVESIKKEKLKADIKVLISDNKPNNIVKGEIIKR